MGHPPLVATPINFFPSTVKKPRYKSLSGCVCLPHSSLEQSTTSSPLSLSYTSLPSPTTMAVFDQSLSEPSARNSPKPLMVIDEKSDVEIGKAIRGTQEEIDYSQRAQWLRAAVLGANDGLVSTASLMMGVGAVKTDPRAMILSGLAGLVAGACSMAIGEFVSVYSQLDIEVAQMKREKEEGKESEEGQLPNPVQAAAASALAFSTGAVVPLLAAAFIRQHEVRMGVIGAAVTLALGLFGAIGAKLGKAPMGKSCARVLVGGWFAMAITFGLMKLFGFSEH